MEGSDVNRNMICAEPWEALSYKELKKSNPRGGNSTILFLTPKLGNVRLLLTWLRESNASSSNLDNLCL